MTEKKQDPRIIRTRSAFQDALFEMLQTRQFEDIRISEIAKKANFSRYAFYSHFDSKEALLFSYIDDLFEMIFQSVYEHFDKEEVIDIKQLSKTVFDLWQSNAEMLRYVIQVAKKDLVIERFRTHTVAFINFYQENNKFASSNHPLENYIIDFAAGGWFMLFKRWTDEDMHVDSETMANLLVDITPTEYLLNSEGN